MKYFLLKLMLIILIFGLVLFTGCKKNKPPDIPSIPSGPSSGSINIDYTFTSSAEDPNEDSVTIRFDWGDGDTSNWSTMVASGDSVSMAHAWSSHDSYYVKAQAKDKKDVTSDWSEGHQIVISMGWIKTFGGSSSDGGSSVQQTSDGGYIIAGGTESYGTGSWDVYLVKTDASGNQQWYRTFGDSSWDEGAYSVQQTTDGGYIIAGITGPPIEDFTDVYLIKTDGSGNEQWYRTFSGSSVDWGYSVQQTTDGGYIIGVFALSCG
jgi:hypothetical protein